MASGVGYYAWKSGHGEEDLSLPSGQIPKACAKKDLPPITQGETDWPCWRGPSHNSFSGVKGIRTDWTGGLKLLWSVDYLCQGDKASTWSSPVVQGNRLVVPGRDEDNDLVFCLNADNGALLWHTAYPAKTKTNYGPGPRATPSIHENKVYTFGRRGDLVCWNLLDGEKIWHKDVSDLGGERPMWGFSSSPYIYKNTVIVQGKGARGVAFHKDTGEVIWESSKEGKSGYAAPVLFKDNLLMFHSEGLCCVDPNNGKKIFNVPWKTSYGVNATTPLVMDDLVFISSHYKMGSMALQAIDNKPKELWRNKAIQAHHTDGILINGFIYTYSGKSSHNRGEFFCLEFKSGEVQWSTKEVGNGTIIHIDGHLLSLDYKGNLYLIKPSPEKFTLITKFPQAIPDLGRMGWSSPVAANNKLYLRYRQRLFCYQLTP